jgi:hypothetical protein
MLCGRRIINGSDLKSGKICVSPNDVTCIINTITIQCIIVAACVGQTVNVRGCSFVVPINTVGWPFSHSSHVYTFFVGRAFLLSAVVLLKKHECVLDCTFCSDGEVTLFMMKKDVVLLQVCVSL